MTRILLDENIPLALRRHLVGHDVWHVRDTGWAGLSNGDLIAAAEAAGFDVMVTADKNLRHQQNLASRRLGLVIVESNNWPLVRSNVDVIARAVSLMAPGSFHEVAFKTPD